jgi:hypothetical protein
VVQTAVAVVADLLLLLLLSLRLGGMGRVHPQLLLQQQRRGQGRLVVVAVQIYHC